MVYAKAAPPLAVRFIDRAIAERADRWHSLLAMRWALPVGILGLWALAGPADARPPLADPIALNIGINCQWQQSCMKTQNKAMKRGLNYVKKTQPPLWRVQMCNRNAGRQRLRVDWVGFDNCIRNTVLRPIPARAVKPASRPARKKLRRLTENAPPPAPPAASAPGPGERG